MKKIILAVALLSTTTFTYAQERTSQVKNSGLYQTQNEGVGGDGRVTIMPVAPTVPVSSPNVTIMPVQTQPLNRNVDLHDKKAGFAYDQMEGGGSGRVTIMPVAPAIPVSSPDVTIMPIPGISGHNPMPVGIPTSTPTTTVNSTVTSSKSNLPYVVYRQLGN